MISFSITFLFTVRHCFHFLANYLLFHLIPVSSFPTQLFFFFFILILFHFKKTHSPPSCFPFIVSWFLSLFIPGKISNDSWKLFLFTKYKLHRRFFLFFFFIQFLFSSLVLKASVSKSNQIFCIKQTRKSKSVFLFLLINQNYIKKRIGWKINVILRYWKALSRTVLSFQKLF